MVEFSRGLAQPIVAGKTDEFRNGGSRTIAGSRIGRRRLQSYVLVRIDSVVDARRKFLKIKALAMRWPSRRANCPGPPEDFSGRMHAQAYG